jgi:hypothetical protein
MLCIPSFLFAETIITFEGESTVATGCNSQQILVTDFGQREAVGFDNVKVTMLESVNNAMLDPEDENNNLFNIYYNPTVEEIPDLKPFVYVKNKFGAVYDGSWILTQNNLRKDVINQEGVAERALEILGFDSLLISDKFVFPSSYSVVKQPSSNISKKWAIMNIYRAIGVQYIDMYSQSYAGDYTLPSSPFASMLSININTVDVSQGLTKVFLSRVNAERYWQRAKDDYIISENESDVNLTLAQFCLLVQKFMDRYGEPVLTDMEEAYLLEVYGRVLPYSLPSIELDAVRYLLARGIVDVNYSFTKPCDLNTALLILMRVKDIDSRDTFKNITFTYDKSILDLGYYPTSVQEREDIVKIVSITPNYSVATHYDYFIKIVADKTRFVDRAGTPVNNLIVSTSPNDLSTDKLEGAYYLGEEDGYYHFVIPVNLPSSILTQDGLITINTVNPLDSPSNFLIQQGGGYYHIGEENNKFTRTPFLSSNDIAYVDIDRKRTSLTSVNERIYLSPLDDLIPMIYKVIATIKQRGSVTIDESIVGDRIQEADGTETNILNIPYNGVDLDKALNTFFDVGLAQIEGSVPIKTFPALGRDGDEVLVSYDYLLNKQWITGLERINDYTWLLYSDTQNIYIDEEHNRIINGNTVYDVPENTKLVYEANGEIFIDYRAVIGWTSQYLLFTDENGVVSISNLRHTWGLENTKPVSLPFNNTDERITVDANNNIVLSSSYKLANYLIYRNMTGVTSVDSIFTFKLKNPNVTVTDSEARTMFKNQLFYDVPSDWLVYSSFLLPDSNATTTNPTDITYTGDGYVYKPKRISEFSQSAYYADTFLPFYIRPDGKFIDMNLNIFSYKNANRDFVTLEYGLFPKDYVKRRPGVSESVTQVYNAALNSNTATIERSLMPSMEIRTAPIAVSYLLRESELHTWESFTALLRSSIYYGTMSVYKVTNGDMQVLSFSPDAGGVIIGSTSADSDSIFRLIFQTYGIKIFSYAGQVFTSVAGEIGEENKPELTEGEVKRAFDWDNFTFYGFVTHLDDIITVCVVVVISILPRIFFFFFLLLLGLVMIADVKAWRVFCNKVFDPYKFLTFGRQTVETINIGKLTIGCVVALIGFGLFQNGLILEIIAWITRAVVGILGR